jgi:hypothetical protein
MTKSKLVSDVDLSKLQAGPAIIRKFVNAYNGVPTMKYSAPLVGMRFHAPAPAILQCLPSGASVTLVPEPENPFDSNAIIVQVRANAIPVDQHEKLAMVLQGYGYSLDDFMGPIPDDTGRPTWPMWKLGHVKANANQGGGASCAAELSPIMAGRTIPGILVFDMDGKPTVEVEL